MDLNRQFKFENLKERIEEIKEWLKKELSGLRTGRATLAVLDGIKVESYGSKLPINQVANIGVEDARTLRISPYDKEQIKSIEKSIIDSNLGLSVSSDEGGLRISFPELTDERRKSLQKVLKEKLEKSRVSLRQERDKVWDNIQEQEKEGEMTEDDKFKLKEEMEELVSKTQKELEEMADKKEKEIKS